MSTTEKWRILYGVDAKLHDELVEAFNRVYEANSKPDGMAMYAHCDSFGSLMGVSITPKSIPHCPFSANWSEIEHHGEFGNIGWAAGDERLKTS